MLSVGNLVRVNDKGIHGDHDDADAVEMAKATANQTGVIEEHPHIPLAMFLVTLLNARRASLGLGPVYALRMTSGPLNGQLLTCFDEEVTVLSNEAEQSAAA